MSIKLNDTQLVLLSAASQRDDHCLVRPAGPKRAPATRLRPLHLVVRETEFCGLRLAGYFRRRMRENSRNSVRRPRCASLTRRNYGGFCLPGNRPGL